MTILIFVISALLTAVVGQFIKGFVEQVLA